MIWPSFYFFSDAKNDIWFHNVTINKWDDNQNMWYIYMHNYNIHNYIIDCVKAKAKECIKVTYFTQ